MKSNLPGNRVAIMLVIFEMCIKDGNKKQIKKTVIADTVKVNAEKRRK